jgi:Fe-Mn family superoxide dismutase
MAFKLPELSYSYTALEPWVDAMTMEIHHSKHHNAYVTNLNKALEGNPAAEWSLEKLMAEISAFPAAVRNNGGGHYNHTLFWNLMAPKKGGAPSGELAEAITAKWGSFDKFKDAFSTAAATRFGSGWAWLIKKDGALEVTSTPNQDNPLMDVAEVKGTPLLCLDVWEHAYYLKYQNKRPDYVAAWWNVVNWDEVTKLYKA